METHEIQERDSACFHSGVCQQFTKSGLHEDRAGPSALVFSKVNSSALKIGVIGWVPAEYKHEPWWRSSDRSRELLDETLGYLYELLLDSGRRSNSPQAASRN